MILYIYVWRGRGGTERGRKGGGEKGGKGERERETEKTNVPPVLVD